MTLKLITFDVTGTILTLRHSVGLQYAKVGSIYGLNPSPDKLSANFKKNFQNLSSEYPNFGEGSIGWEKWWKYLVFNTFEKSLSEKLQSETADKIYKDLVEIYKTDQCWKVVDGALDLLDVLHKTNPLGVLSNYDPRLEEILKNLKLRDYFQFVMTSYKAKFPKPYKGIFKAVEDLNCSIKKSEILHIGDNPKLDFQGARVAGWNAILVANNLKKINEHYPEIEKEWIVKNITEVHSLLKQKRLL